MADEQRDKYLKALAITVKSASTAAKVAEILNEAKHDLEARDWKGAALVELWGDLLIAIKEQYHGQTDANFIEAQAIIDRWRDVKK
ncbi:MAG: hypothetical protein JST22_03640 [Bacteroidetes bacterium]|nr:hypothetical protein [Bacteroidota bacterium]